MKTMPVTLVLAALEEAHAAYVVVPMAATPENPEGEIILGVEIEEAVHRLKRQFSRDKTVEIPAVWDREDRSLYLGPSEEG